MKKINLNNILIGAIAVLALFCLVTIVTLGIAFQRAVRDKDQAVDLGYSLLAGQNVSIRQALSGFNSEDLIISYCSLADTDDSLCDAFAESLKKRAAGDMYSYHPAEVSPELAQSILNFLAKAKESDNLLADGWLTKDPTFWEQGAKIRKYLQELLLLIPDSQNLVIPGK